MATDTRPDRQRPFQDRELAREAGRKGGLGRQRQIREEREALEALPGGAEGAALGGTAALGEDASAILSKLRSQARKGDVAAARLVLDYSRRDQTEGLSKDALRMAEAIERLPLALKRTLLSIVLDLAREQESPAQEDNRQGSIEGDQSLPSAREEEREADPHPPEPRDSDAARGTDSPAAQRESQTPA